MLILLKELNLYSLILKKWNRRIDWIGIEQRKCPLNGMKNLNFWLKSRTKYHNKRYHVSIGKENTNSYNHKILPQLLLLIFDKDLNLHQHF